MTVEFSSQYTKRICNWTQFKDFYYERKSNIQYEDLGDYYWVWFYDGPELFLCTIWKNEIPADISFATNLTQLQNDIDKLDFENNFKSKCNISINKLANTGVVGQAPAKGLGGFAPDPTNNPYEPFSDEIVSLYVDGEGSLITRGASLTDEGSLREDFTGNSVETQITGTVTFKNGSDIVDGYQTDFSSELNRDCYIRPTGTADWYKIVRAPTATSCQIDHPYTGSDVSSTAEKTRWITVEMGYAPGSVDVNNSCLKLISGMGEDSSISIYREGDYLPILLNITATVSQRISNQEVFFGLRDDVHNPNMFCDVLLDGYDNTVLKFRSAWNTDTQVSVVKLPAGLTTASEIRYKIDVSAEYCGLLINGVLVAKHENHIPDPYTDLNICAGINNFTNVASNTDLIIDTIFFSNQDQVQIANTFLAPIPVISKEDQHSIIGRLTTTSTSANQNIISYTVPDGKVFYIVGYRIECSGTIDGTVKIGKNILTSTPSSPGLVDSNVFRAFSLQAGSNTGEVDFSNPRKIGVGGDVIKITVTPKGSLTCDWYAVLDYVLR